MALRSMRGVNTSLRNLPAPALRTSNSYEAHGI